MPLGFKEWYYQVQVLHYKILKRTFCSKFIDFLFVNFLNSFRLLAYTKNILLKKNNED